MTSLKVKIIPNSSVDEFVGWQENILKIKIKAVPEKGKANQALIKFLSKKLKIPKKDIEIVSGATARLKKICFQNITVKELDLLLQNQL